MTNAEHDRRIDYIEFSVKSVAEAKQFYGGAFGWTFEDYGPDYASFADGRLVRRFPDRTAGENWRTAGGHLCGRSRSLGAAGQTSGRKDRPLHFQLSGGRRFHFADPSGNELAVWSDK